MFFPDFDMFFNKAMVMALIVQISKKIYIDVANIQGSHNKFFFIKRWKTKKLLKKVQKNKNSKI